MSPSWSNVKDPPSMHDAVNHPALEPTIDSIVSVLVLGSYYSIHDLGSQVPIEGLLYENLSVVHLLPCIPGAVTHTIWQLPCSLSVKIIETN